MRWFVTGGTGQVGLAIVAELLQLDEVETVDCLVRDVARAKRLLPDNPRLRLLRGDLPLDSAAAAEVSAALASCTHLVHSAGLPEQWQPDPAIFHRVNVDGTSSILAALGEARRGLTERVRVLLISTMDVCHCEPHGTLVETREATEADLGKPGKNTPYEISKFRQLQVARRMCAEGAMDLVVLCPSAVYGPCKVKTGLNNFIADFINGEVPALPSGGFPVCYSKDVALAVLAAARVGRVGELYLVGGEYLTNKQVAMAVLVAMEPSPPSEERMRALERQLPYAIPLWVMRLLAKLSAYPAWLLGKEPIIPPTIVSFLGWSPRVNCDKAHRELGYNKDRPFAEGVRSTIESLRAEGFIKIK